MSLTRQRRLRLGVRIYMDLRHEGGEQKKSHLPLTDLQLISNFKIISTSKNVLWKKKKKKKSLRWPLTHCHRKECFISATPNKLPECHLFITLYEVRVKEVSFFQTSCHFWLRKSVTWCYALYATWYQQFSKPSTNQSNRSLTFVQWLMIRLF